MYSFFLRELHCAVQAGLELKDLLPPKCWRFQACSTHTQVPFNLETVKSQESRKVIQASSMNPSPYLPETYILYSYRVVCKPGS